MYCTVCGKCVPDGRKFCTACGAPMTPVEDLIPAPLEMPAPEPVAMPAPEPTPVPEPAPAPAFDLDALAAKVADELERRKATACEKRPPMFSAAEEIRRFKALYDDGILTADEYTAQKAKLLMR